MTTINLSDLTPLAQARARLIRNNGGQPVARLKGRGYQVDDVSAGQPGDHWLQVVFPENTDAEPAETDFGELSRTEPTAYGGFELIPLDQIDPNPYQPRQSQDAEALESLARGLRLKREQLPTTCGLMQVPIARQTDVGRYELAFGHRRWSAFQLLHEQYGEEWGKMPLNLVALDDEQMYDYAARENGDREDINPIEKARSIKRAQDELGWDLTRAANAHGLSKSAGSNLVRLLQLPAAVQQLIAIHDLSQRHGRELVRLLQVEPPLTEQCLRQASYAVNQEMSVAATKGAVDHHLEQKIRAEARLAYREMRYCRRCGAEREFTGLEINEGWDDFKCERCFDTARPNLWRSAPLPAEAPAAPPTSASSVEPPATAPTAWNEAPRAELWVEAPPPAEPRGEPSARAQAEGFDCPRCQREKIVKVNGGALCLNCSSRWATADEFHAERTSLVRILAQPDSSQPVPLLEQQRPHLQIRVMDRFRSIVQAAPLEMLPEIETWLDDLEAFISQ